MSRTLELFPRTRFKFTNLVAGQSLAVPVVCDQALSGFGSATLVVRVHEVDIDGGSTVTVSAKATSPTCDDPAQDFVDPEALAQVELTSSAAVGDLEVAALGPTLADYVSLTVTGFRASTENVDATLSAQLVLHETAHGALGGGNLHSAATTAQAGFLSASDKTKLDALPMTPTAITGTTSAGTSPALYLCSPSSSNIDVDLPAASGNAGLRVGVKMVDSNSTTRTVTLGPSGAETIDGKTSVKLYIDGDYLEVECDGQKWHVVVDGRIAHRSIMRRAASQSISHNTITLIEFDTSSDLDVGKLATTGASAKFTVKRAGSYMISASVKLPNIDDGERLTLRVRKNSTYQNFVNTWSPASNRELAISLTCLLELAANDTIDALVYHDEGASLSTSTTLEDRPRISIADVLPARLATAATRTSAMTSIRRPSETSRCSTDLTSSSPVTAYGLRVEERRMGQTRRSCPLRPQPLQEPVRGLGSSMSVLSVSSSLSAPRRATRDGPPRTWRIKAECCDPLAACIQDEGCLCYVECLAQNDIWTGGQTCGWNMAFGDLAGCQGRPAARPACSGTQRRGPCMLPRGERGRCEERSSCWP